MLETIAWVSLILCVINWAIFAYITFVVDLPQLRALAESLLNRRDAAKEGGMGVTVQHSGIDAAKVAEALGALAGAFKKAGPAPTSAALSVLFLLVAVAAAGLESL